MRATMIGSLLSLFIATSAYAQTAAPASTQAPEEPQTLANGASGRAPAITGWFVAPTFGTTGFGGNIAYEPGLRAGVYLNRHVAIGGTINGLGTGDTHVSDRKVRNVGAYGGLLLQYVVQSNRLLHTSFETTIGSGKWCNLIDDQQDGCSGRRFLAFEPAANVELNVARHVRIATGVGYRFAVAGTGDGPSSSGMSSLVARTSVIFGSF